MSSKRSPESLKLKQSNRLLIVLIFFPAWQYVSMSPTVFTTGKRSTGLTIPSTKDNQYLIVADPVSPCVVEGTRCGRMYGLSSAIVNVLQYQPWLYR